MAILSDRGLAGLVRSRAAVAPMGPHRHRRTTPAGSASRSRRRHQCARPSCWTQASARLLGSRPMTKSPRQKAVVKRIKPAPRPQAGMALHTADGARKYLTTGERDAFLRGAEQADRQVRTLCMTLAYAG